MTTDGLGNIHDNASGRFSEKRKTPAAADLLQVPCRRRAAISLNVPASMDREDVAIITGTRFGDANATAYMSFGDLRSDLRDGFLNSDGTDSAKAGDPLRPKRQGRFIVLTDIPDGSTVHDMADHMNADIHGAEATVYENVGALLADYHDGVIDHFGMPTNADLERTAVPLAAPHT